MHESINLAFLGDISLNDDYLSVAKEGKNPFQKVEQILFQTDLVVGNLEAMLKGTQEEGSEKQTTLYVEYESLRLLKHLHINIVTLANNHVYDQLLDGFTSTISFLEQENIGYLGASFKSGHSENAYIANIKGRKVGLLNYIHNNTNPLFPDNCTIDVNTYNRERIINDVRKLSPSVDLVVLLLHWGLDNSRFPAPWQRKDARTFVKAGARLIIGHHTHVLQGFEKIDKSYIFYGLGNFAFSRLNSNGLIHDLDDKRHRESVILIATLTDQEIEIGINPVKLNGIEISPVKSTQIEKVTRLLPFVSNPLIWPFYFIYLNFVYKAYFFLFGNNRNAITQLKSVDSRKLRRLKRLLFN